MLKISSLAFLIVAGILMLAVVYLGVLIMYSGDGSCFSSEECYYEECAHVCLDAGVPPPSVKSVNLTDVVMCVCSDGREFHIVW